MRREDCIPVELSVHPLSDRVYDVATFYHDEPCDQRAGRQPLCLAYVRDYNAEWAGYKLYRVRAVNCTEAKRAAIKARREFEIPAPSRGERKEKG